MIVFARYQGLDIIGFENTMSGHIEDVFCIRDMPRSDGNTIFLFPSVMPFRSTMFCTDIDGKRKKFSVLVNSCTDVKTQKEMELLDKEMCDYMVSEYQKLVGFVLNII